MYIDGAVVKIASRCNIDCKYCYIYNKGDDTFLNQSKFMSNEVIEQFAKKVETYVTKHNKKAFIIVFHGGEPMVAGKKRIRNFIETMGKITANVDFHYAIQTNGTLINKEWCDFFEEMKISVGISVDGTKESNDFFRVYKNGESAYSKILGGIEILQNYGNKKFGVLTVMDIKQRPEDVFNHYKQINVTHANLLFPDDTHDDSFEDDLSLGKWLSLMYDLWDKNQGVEIEQFIKITGLIMGVSINDEYYGKGKPNTFILETNGEFQANDPIRVCKNGMSKTDMNVFENEIDELFELPISFLYYNNHKLLCDKCDKCELNTICGGGYVLNRYSTSSGFDNPSIYCKSLAYFICHVQNRLLSALDPEFIKQKEVTPLVYENLLDFLDRENDVPNYFLQSFK